MLGQQTGMPALFSEYSALVRKLEKRLTTELNEMRNYGKKFSTAENFQGLSKSAKLAVQEFKFEHLEEWTWIWWIGNEVAHIYPHFSHPSPVETCLRSQRTCQFSMRTTSNSTSDYITCPSTMTGLIAGWVTDSNSQILGFARIHYDYKTGNTKAYMIIINH